MKYKMGGDTRKDFSIHPPTHPPSMYPSIYLHIQISRYPDIQPPLSSVPYSIPSRSFFPPSLQQYSNSNKRLHSALLPLSLFASRFTLYALRFTLYALPRVVIRLPQRLVRPLKVRRVQPMVRRTKGVASQRNRNALEKPRQPTLVFIEKRG